MAHPVGLYCQSQTELVHMNIVCSQSHSNNLFKPIHTTTTIATTTTTTTTTTITHGMVRTLKSLKWGKIGRLTYLKMLTNTI